MWSPIDGFKVCINAKDQMSAIENSMELKLTTQKPNSGNVVNAWNFVEKQKKKSKPNHNLEFH